MNARVLLPLVGVLLAAALAPGCFRSRDQVTAKESIGYFQFTGAIEGARATVKNDTKTFYDQVELQPNTRYSIRPGNYDVVVEKEGRVVVRRRLFVAEDQSREVAVP
jgi:hypothetical protein